MAASTFAAYGLYPQSTGLRNVTQALLQGGFEKESICMMLPAEHPISALVRKASADPLQGPSHTEAAGLIAWLSEFGAVLIPSFGFFIRSQEFFRTLMAGDTPAGGSLAALGFPDEKVRRFSSQADNAGVLLYLSCGEQTKTGSVLELLRGTGAEETGVLSTDGAVPVAA